MHTFLLFATWLEILTFAPRGRVRAANCKVFKVGRYFPNPASEKKKSPRKS